MFESPYAVKKLELKFFSGLRYKRALPFWSWVVVPKTSTKLRFFCEQGFQKDWLWLCSTLWLKKGLIRRTLRKGFFFFCKMKSEIFKRIGCGVAQPSPRVGRARCQLSPTSISSSTPRHRGHDHPHHSFFLRIILVAFRQVVGHFWA